MIVREILNDPDRVIRGFDFFNDATDTMLWLKSLRTEHADWVVEKLNAEFGIWAGLNNRRAEAGKS